MITSIDIRESAPFAGGMSFGKTGAYVRIVGVAKGEIDPGHPANQGPANTGIVDLDKAPRNPRGRVEYEADIFILRPADAAKGNGRLFYEVNNRGGKHLFARFCHGMSDNALITGDTVGDAMLLKRGYTLVWSGWDPNTSRANHGLALTAPVAMENGKPIVQRIREEFIYATRTQKDEIFRLSYPAASTDKAQAKLTVRRRYDDAPSDVPAANWEFIDSRSFQLLPKGSKPEPGSLYDLYYPATNSQVSGLGFAAIRDVVSHLRHEGARGILGAPVAHTLGAGFSQSARLLRNFIAEHFNRDEKGRRVFDGVLGHVGGAGRVFLNARFAQPWRTGTRHQDYAFPEVEFPFSTESMRDPITGKTAGLFHGDGTDPKFMQSNSSTEYWQKGASLLHTDAMGEHDVAQSQNSRVYLIAGTQHGVRPGMEKEVNPAHNPPNPHAVDTITRALLIALDEWVADGKAPPPSRVPTLADGTLVAPEEIGFPAIPGVAVAREANRLAPLPDWVNPKPPQKFYRSLVSKVDEDGNEIGGIRTPEIAVPVATFTGWNLYKSPFPEGVLADRDGSFVPFAATREDRIKKGDPRKSLAERYAGHADYVAKVKAAAETLVRERLLLPEDVDYYVSRAQGAAGFKLAAE